MSKVLILKANPEGENSYTNRLVNHFIEQYSKSNPKDTISVKDVDSLGVVATDKDMLIYRDNKLVDHDKEELYGHFDQLAEDFLGYDKFVFAYPNWDLLVPPSLVNYVLWVFRSKHLYDESGNSRLNDKKALIIYTSGVYTSGKNNTSYGLSWLASLLEKYEIGKCYYINADGLELQYKGKDNYEIHKSKVIELAKIF